MAHDIIVGVALPSNVEEAAKKLAIEIKGLDTWVESVKSKIPEGTYMAWKYWAKATSDAMIAVALKSPALDASRLALLWPAGAALAGAVKATDKAFDDASIAAEYAKLRIWRQTFQQAGATPPGPEPTPPPGIGVPGGGTDLVSGITKVAVIGTLLIGGLMIVSNLTR